MKRPGEGDGQGEHGANCGHLDHRAKGLIVVDAGSLGLSLGEAMKNPTSLVPFQGAVGIELVLENLVAGDNVGANGVRDKIPGVVGNQDSKFFFHGAVPIQIDEGGMEGGGHRQHGRCRSGRQGESVGRKPEAPLHPRDHQMRIERRSHQYDLCQQRLLM
jgi:hypothetical protein